MKQSSGRYQGTEAIPELTCQIAATSTRVVLDDKSSYPSDRFNMNLVLLEISLETIPVADLRTIPERIIHSHPPQVQFQEAAVRTSSKDP